MLNSIDSVNYMNVLQFASDIWEDFYYDETSKGLTIICGDDIIRVRTNRTNKFGRYVFMHMNTYKDLGYRRLFEHRSLEFGIFLTISNYVNRGYEVPVSNIGDWKYFKNQLTKYIECGIYS